MLAKTCIVKTDEEISWTAKIVKEGSNYFICEGEWPQFVAYHKLELDDLLVFFLISKSAFQVLRYNKNCCGSLLGRQVFDELSSEEEEDIPPSRNSKKAKMEPVVPVHLHSGESSKKPKTERSEEEIHAALENILKNVDGNTATLSEIMQLVGSHFSMNLWHRVAEVKAAVNNVLRSMDDEEERVNMDDEEESFDPSSAGKSSKEPKAEPSEEEIYAAVVNILKEVDFNTVTYNEFIQLVGTHFSMDLRHRIRIAEVKALVEDVRSQMDDEEESADPSSGSRDGENPSYAKF